MRNERHGNNLVLGVVCVCRGQDWQQCQQSYSTEHLVGVGVRMVRPRRQCQSTNSQQFTMEKLADGQGRVRSFVVCNDAPQWLSIPMGVRFFQLCTIAVERPKRSMRRDCLVGGWRMSVTYSYHSASQSTRLCRGKAWVVTICKFPKII